MATIKFFLDENMPVAVAEQLRRRGIAAITVTELGLKGESDLAHLKRAEESGFVFCTHDADLLDLAGQGVTHAGIIFGQQELHGIGDWVEFLVLVNAVLTAEEMIDKIEFI
ncbi:MAG: DUF5615 family PIN-like protein [Anaerolineae bacterium]|nr:DUF5615 family PIN-like protein [Anaerolineae bacterium]